MACSKKRDLIINTIKQQTKEFHPTEIAGLTGASVPYVNNIILSLFATKQLEEIKDGRKTLFKLIVGKIIADPQHNETPFTDKIQEYSVKERFSYVENFSQIVIDGILPSMFLTGVSGIGKTHLILKMLQRNELKNNEDYVIIKGHSSPFGLYSTLYWNQSNLVIFDDCDKAFENEISANILKAALDSYDKRIVSWVSRTIPKESDIEDRFEFTGQIIFISNKLITQVDDSIRTRTLCVNLFMNRSEITEYMRDKLSVIEPNQPMKLKEEVLVYLETIQEDFTKYNLRTLIKSIRIRSCYNDENIWKNMIKISAQNE